MKLCETVLTYARIPVQQGRLTASPIPFPLVPKMWYHHVSSHIHYGFWVLDTRGLLTGDEQKIGWILPPPKKQSTLEGSTTPRPLGVEKLSWKCVDGSTWWIARHYWWLQRILSEWYSHSVDIQILQRGAEKPPDYKPTNMASKSYSKPANMPKMSSVNHYSM